MMSTDPFDEAPHDPHGNNRPILPAIVHRQTASSSEGNGFAASCVSPHNPKGSPAALSPKGPANFGRNDPHHSTERAVPHTDVLHRRGMSVDHSLDSTSLVPPALHHPRTRSSDIDDHMAGSVYAPHEICPKCGFARSSSIFCHVTKMHHGTDEPLQEAKPKGFFARLRGASNSDDDQPAGEALASGAEPSADQLPTDRPATVDDASPTPKKKGWSIFKSKEEKQIIALEDEEEEARKKLVKSKSNPDGEKHAYELLQAAFEQGVKDIHKRDKARHAMCKTETEARDDIETAEEKGRKEWTKDEAKARKKLPASCHVLAPSSSGTLSAQPSAGSMGSPANHTGDVGTPCADGEGASVQSHP